PRPSGDPTRWSCPKSTVSVPGSHRGSLPWTCGPRPDVRARRRPSVECRKQARAVKLRGGPIWRLSETTPPCSRPRRRLAGNRAGSPAAAGASVELIDEVLAAASARRAAITGYEDARADQKSFSSQIAKAPKEDKPALIAEGKQKSEAVKSLSAESEEARFAFDQ